METFAIEPQNWSDYEWFFLVLFCYNRPRVVDFISPWTGMRKNCFNVFLFWCHSFYRQFETYLRLLFVYSSSFQAHAFLISFDELRYKDAKLLLMYGRLQFEFCCNYWWFSDTLSAEAWDFTSGATQEITPRTFSNCVTFSSSGKTGQFTGVYGPKISRRMQTTARINAWKLRALRQQDAG